MFILELEIQSLLKAGKWSLPAFIFEAGMQLKIPNLLRSDFYAVMLKSDSSGDHLLGKKEDFQK